MVVVTAVVEADKRKFKNLLDFTWCWVYHTNYCFVRSFIFPTNHEQIWEHLDVEEHKFLRSIYLSRAWVLRSKLHAPYSLQTLQGTIGTVVGKPHNFRAQVSYIVMHPRRICIVKDFKNEIDRRFGSWMNLLVEVSKN